jgi:hypothetical protein
MTNGEPSPVKVDSPESAEGAGTQPGCPVCRYDFSGFQGVDPPNCPECGNDPTKVRSAIATWHRNARRWAWGAVLVFLCCLVGTVCSGTGSAVFFEVVVGVVAVGVIAGWAWVSDDSRGVPRYSLVDGAVARVVAPIAVYPILFAAIWAWYVPLAFSRGGNRPDFDSATATLGRLTLIALITCAFVWAVAFVAGLWRAAFTGQMVRCGFSMALASVGIGVLGVIAVVATLFSLVGGDGMGP